MNWYAVQTKPNRENSAVVHLHRQGFEVWLPTIERRVRHARRLRLVRKPFFPGYLFVKMDLSKARWRLINSTIGVSRIVCFGKEPSRVSPQFINGLEEMLKSDAAAMVNDGLEIDQDVEILSGPMAGLFARLINLNSATRVTVMLRLLGNEVRASIARDTVISA